MKERGTRHSRDRTGKGDVGVEKEKEKEGEKFEFFFCTAHEFLTDYVYEFPYSSYSSLCSCSGFIFVIYITLLSLSYVLWLA